MSAENAELAAELRSLHDRALQQPISYKPLFERMADIAEGQFKRVMAVESALREAFIAMKIAAALPSVAAEYDFSSAIATCERVLRTDGQ